MVVLVVGQYVEGHAAEHLVHLRRVLREESREVQQGLVVSVGGAYDARSVTPPSVHAITAATIMRVVIPDTVFPPVLRFAHHYPNITNPRSNLCGSARGLRVLFPFL